jgi:hypothetical protein
MRYVVVFVVLLGVLLGRQFLPDLIKRLDTAGARPAEVPA